VSRGQLAELGVSAATVDHWVRRSRLHVVHRGVYAVGHGALRVEGRRLAAVLACGRGAVLSHRGAAAHWGLLRTDQTGVDANSALDAPDHPAIVPDFYFPAHRLIVETDGWDTHRTKAAFKSDRRKDAALTAAGYRVMRFTYDDVVYEPDTVVARLTPRSAPA
jgi:very-short-patch-repair endonuclease